jgi:hypothetical protein
LRLVSVREDEAASSDRPAPADLASPTHPADRADHAEQAERADARVAQVTVKVLSAALVVVAAGRAALCGARAQAHPRRHGREAG